MGPNCGAKMDKLEKLQYYYSGLIPELRTLSYEDRLKKMKITSSQRRYDRSRIFYIWKIMQEMIPNFEITWDFIDRRGTMVILGKISSKIPKKVLNLRDQSLSVHGEKLFNLLPRLRWK